MRFRALNGALIGIGPAEMRGEEEDGRNLGVALLLRESEERIQNIVFLGEITSTSLNFQNCVNLIPKL